MKFWLDAIESSSFKELFKFWLPTVFLSKYVQPLTNKAYLFILFVAFFYFDFLCFFFFLDSL